MILSTFGITIVVVLAISLIGALIYFGILMLNSPSQLELHKNLNLGRMSQKSSRVFKQSGVIPYRVRNGKIQFLLITNRRRQHWLIPKGGIKRAMDSPDSAAKEAWEEAGVLGQVDANKIGTYEYHKRAKTYQVEVFLLSVETVLKDWPEASTRKRQWLGVTKAVKQVESAELKRILKSSSNQITSMNRSPRQA